MAMNSYQSPPQGMGMQGVAPVFQLPVTQVPYGYAGGAAMMAGPQGFANAPAGVYIVPQYPPQGQMMYAMPGFVQQGGPHPSLGLRAAHTYFTSPTDMAEVQRKYGLTEQGDFKVGLTDSREA